MENSPATLTFLTLALAAIPAARGATGLVTFDPPRTPQGPSIYVAVPGPQTIAAPEATFSGGVVLGLATFFPAIQFATGPNVYGTADFGNGLARTLTIDIAAALPTTEVSFALFNGETFLQSYVVNAFNGSNLVASQTIASILPNFNSGFALVDVASAAGITSVTVDAINPPGVWDFLIDTVAFNQNITSVIPNAPPPPVYSPNVPAPVTLAPVTVTYTEPDTIDVHGHKQKGKTKTLQNQVINYGDDLNNAKGHFETLPTTPVPEASTWAMLLAGLAAMGMSGLRRRRIGAV